MQRFMNVQRKVGATKTFKCLLDTVKNIFQEMSVPLLTNQTLSLIVGY